MAESLFYHDALSALAEQEVRFVVVGGVAVNLRGVPRSTADLDIAVELEKQNLIRAQEALTGVGLLPLLPESADKLADTEVLRDWIETRNLRAFTFQDPSNPLKQVDLVIATEVSFADIDADADEFGVGPLRIRVASVATLIRMKSGTGRDQDASDIDALRRVLELGDE